MRWKSGAFLSVVLLLAGLPAGCGDGDSKDSGGTASETVTRAQTAQEPLDDLAQSLKAAGLSAQESASSGVTDALTVGGVEIIYYADPHKAAVTGAEIGRTMANHPRNGLAETYGQVIVWTANQNGLTSEERARFQDVAAIVEKNPAP